MYRKLFSKIEPLLTENFSTIDKKIWFEKIVTQMAMFTGMSIFIPIISIS